MADTIKVNAAQWQALSQQDQDRVTQILKASGLLRDATIVADASTPQTVSAAGAGFQPQFSFPIPGVCKALCDVAEAAAVAGCSAVTGGIAAAACAAAAHAAGELCRSKC